MSSNSRPNNNSGKPTPHHEAPAWGVWKAWGMGHVQAGADGQGKNAYGFKAYINVDEDGLIKSTARP